MKPAIPLGPIVLFLCSIAIFIGSTALYLTEFHSELVHLPERTPTTHTVANLEIPKINAPNKMKDYAKVILQHSSFAADRTQFERHRAPASRRTPELKPQFVGAMGESENRRIMIIWRTGENAKIHSVGDQTPWGRLSIITKTEAKFETSSETKSLKLF